jgi:tetratricopeptide (TPR) repeat protein
MKASTRPSSLAAPAFLLLAVAATYATSLSVPFVFDDKPTLLSNESIKSFATAWVPPTGGITTSGRPLLNLSFALNYAVSGLAVWSYHALNILIHAAAAVTLWGILRRIPGVSATAAFVAALLWSIHPLQTESVTYIVQRAESLAGLFYLLLFYCFLRWAEAPAGGRTWKYLSIAACALGMTTKEILVTAPVMVLLFDRTLLSGTFREALTRRTSYYISLAVTWLIQAFLVLRTGTRGGTAGFGLGIGPWQYWQTQFRAFCHYLRLIVVPHPLVIDYGVQWEKSLAPVLGFGGVVLLLAGLTVYALTRPLGSRGRAAGFAGAWMFLLLAPTSLIPGTRQTMAEHRMYLPLAAVTILAAVAGARVLGKAFLAVGLAVAALFIVLTIRRNQIYQSEATLWADTVIHVPQNAYAWNNLGVELEEAGYAPQAKAAYQHAIDLNPKLSTASNNLGDLALAAGDPNAAIPYYQEAIRSKPDYFNPHYSLGGIFLHLGRMSEAAVQFQACLEIQPGFAGAELGWGDALAEQGKYPEAEQHLRAALAIAPHLALAYNDLGNVLLAQHHVPEAIAMYDRAIEIDPKYASARRNRELARAKLP